jgi:hypothetical protein
VGGFGEPEGIEGVEADIAADSEGARDAMRTSFPASLDGSLKDVVPPRA